MMQKKGSSTSLFKLDIHSTWQIMQTVKACDPPERHIMAWIKYVDSTLCNFDFLLYTKAQNLRYLPGIFVGIYQFYRYSSSEETV